MFILSTVMPFIPPSSGDEGVVSVSGGGWGLSLLGSGLAGCALGGGIEGIPMELSCASEGVGNKIAISALEHRSPPMHSGRLLSLIGHRAPEVRSVPQPSCVAPSHCRSQ